jgi:hypothetical protein
MCVCMYVYMPKKKSKPKQALKKAGSKCYCLLCTAGRGYQRRESTARVVMLCAREVGDVHVGWVDSVRSGDEDKKAEK